jgi:acetyl esterase/lipase
MKALAPFLLMLAPLLSAGAPAKAAKGAFAVEAVKNVAYVAGRDADPERHKVDLFLPKGKKDFPVLLFAHGGGWKNGRKDEFAFLGQALARHGVGVVTTNYRLYPKVKYPANVADVARAVAWTHKNIARYGGRADALFLGGHSAGGHLVSLLATDESYLQAEGLGLANIRGVVSISGLYAVPRGRFPLFEDSDEGARKASPIRQVKGRHPPFLLVYADGDFPGFGAMAEDFAKALRGAKGEVTCLKVNGRTHGSVAAKIGEEGDPVRQAILDFVAGQRGKKDDR